VPADLYRSSGRAMPEKICEWEYGESCIVQKVMLNGRIRIKGGTFLLSDAFTGLNIALEEGGEDGFMNILYRNFKIAVADVKDARNGISMVKKITKLGGNV
jgi:hypothetical protein